MNSIDVKDLREKNGLTQAALAQIMGVSTQTVKNWESGKKIPSTALMKLKEVFAETNGETKIDFQRDNLGRILSIMEKDHQLIRDILDKKDETIDRLLSIVEAEVGIGKKDADAAS